MRAGICSIQQALTPEAAGTVRQAVSLARRRGHAQVSPLHVASVMLASSTGLLKRACLQSQSHPLQLKALELCFNVALNRLPTSTSSPLVCLQSSYPSVSNALVAAFKRAQAHQRRGSIESQQQPILALKIELEQLVVSILDDPSVSRVMREARFSSTSIKNKVEHAISLEVSSQCSPPVSIQPKECMSKPLALCPNVPPEATVSKPYECVRNEDVNSVLSELVKKKNTVILGECLSSSEAVVKSVIKKLERGEDIPTNLRYMQFINLPLSSLRNLYKDDVEKKIMELRCLVKNYGSRGVVLYLGDLKWVSDFWSNYGEQRRSYYCPVEHIIIELKRLVSGFGESERLWLLGIATLRTYMKCKAGQPSLETLWDLHPLTIPVGSLSLSLNFHSDLEIQYEIKTPKDESFTPQLDMEVHGLESSSKEPTTITSTSSSLPLWLQQYKEESQKNNITIQDYANDTDESQRWNSISSTVKQDPVHTGKALNFISSCPSSTSSSSSEGNHSMHQTGVSWSMLETKEVQKEPQFWTSETESKPELLSNPNSSPNSASSSEMDIDIEDDMFKEFNDEKLKILCDALENRVPWQQEVIPDIATTILQCRSRMTKSQLRKNKEETWLFFLGGDSEGKEKIARELAKVVFGCQSNFASISLSSFACTKSESTDDHSRNKRRRDEKGSSYIERFTDAVNENPHQVFFMEDLEQVDYYSQKGIKKAIESGELTLPAGGEKIPLKDAIIIFSCESFSSDSRPCSSPRNKTSCHDNEDIRDVDEPAKRASTVSLDLNMTNDGDSGDEHLTDEIGILESVDKQITFKVQEL